MHVARSVPGVGHGEQAGAGVRPDPGGLGEVVGAGKFLLRDRHNHLHLERERERD